MRLPKNMKLGKSRMKTDCCTCSDAPHGRFLHEPISSMEVGHDSAFQPSEEHWLQQAY
jgi:hypothetical protein